MALFENDIFRSFFQPAPSHAENEGSIYIKKIKDLALLPLLGGASLGLAYLLQEIKHRPMNTYQTLLYGALSIVAYFY